MEYFKIENEGPATLLSGGDFVLTPPTPEVPKLETPTIEDKKPEVVENSASIVPDKTESKAESEKPKEEQVKSEIKPEHVVPPDFSALLGEATKGTIKTTEELSQALDQLRQLREESQKPKYKSPQEEKIAQFLAEYQGQDFGTSFQMYLKLNSMDVKSLDPTAAIKEVMILDNMKLGMSPAESEQLASEEIENKYANDTNGLNQKRDSIVAKQKLEALQQESKAPTANPQQEAQKQQLQEQQLRLQKVRADYLSKTEEVFKKPSEAIKIKVSEDPKEDLTFKPYDTKDQTGKRVNTVDLRPLVEHYDEKVIQGRYGIKNDKGELVGFNPELIAQDLEKVFSFEQRIKEAVEHGIHIGTERYIKERANIKPPAPNSNATKGVAESKFGEFIFQKPN